MNNPNQSLWQRFCGIGSSRLSFAITTIVTFIGACFAIAISGNNFEPALCLGAAIFCLACGTVVAAITVCIGNREARRRTWNEPRWFFLFLMLVCFIAGGSMGVIASQQKHPAPLCIIVALIAAFFFLLSFLALILSVIPWTRPLMNWVLRRRFFVLTSIITAVVLFYTEENWRGKRAWESYKQTQEAKGEYFDFKHIMPPPVPDEQNFAMSPLLKPELEYHYSDHGVVWEDTNGLARLERLSDGLPERQGEGKKDYYPNLGDMFSGKTAGFSSWHDYF
ncbi:MAG: hypothetical protein RLZZ350_567, partial [Verrucomicrobiota bacterium]